MERVVINKEKLKTAIENKKYTKEKLSEEMGRSKTYVNQILSGNVSEIKESDERFLCLLLGLKPGELIKEDDTNSNSWENQAEILKTLGNMTHTMKTMAEKLTQLLLLYNEMSEDIETLKRKASANTVQLERIKENLDKPTKSENDRAKEFLVEIMKNGRINGAEVLRMADEAGIDRGRLLRMIKEMGIQVETVGYGNNQKSYWYMPKG